MWWMALLDKVKGGEAAGGRDYGASQSATQAQAQPTQTTTADTAINGDLEPAATPETNSPPATADSDVNGAQSEQDQGSGNGGQKAMQVFQQIGAKMKEGGQNQRGRRQWGAY